MKDIKYDFDGLRSIMKKLLSEGGCPWDRAQTHESLKRYLIEECYEVIDAIEKNDMVNLCEELGDVLLQVMFHSQVEENKGNFNIDDVVNGISLKMINRHTHIFSDATADTPQEVSDNWEKIKIKEKGYTSYTEVMKSVPKIFPALIRAEKVQKKASDVGFDFKNFDDALLKVYEEIEELKEVKNKSDEEKMEEYGDLLFSIVNISRFLKINPEFALTNSLEKFINRFEYIENVSISKGLSIYNLSLEEMDILWNESKVKK